VGRRHDNRSRSDGDNSSCMRLPSGASSAPKAVMSRLLGWSAKARGYGSAAVASTESWNGVVAGEVEPSPTTSRSAGPRRGAGFFGRWRGRHRLLRAESQGVELYCWKTMPRSLPAAKGAPSNVSSPAVAGSRPATIRRRVDLHIPEGTGRRNESPSPGFRFDVVKSWTVPLRLRKVFSPFQHERGRHG